MFITPNIQTNFTQWPVRIHPSGGSQRCLCTSRSCRRARVPAFSSSLSDAPHFPSLTESLLGGELRCHCLQTVSGLISPKHLVHVEIIPKGPQCGTVEVIATLKTSQQICLDPEAKWVKMIINRILSR
uniref:C-X-C motif chemokine n=1 Tax=Terrapene triunguis TaxID=2587831 RepID=A0A674IHB6_9SAUR